MRNNLGEAIALPSSPCFPELMGVGEDAIALPSFPFLPELMGVGEDAIAQPQPNARQIHC